MKKAVLLLVLFSFLFIGCSKVNTTEPVESQTGGLLFRLDPETIPANVSTVNLKMTRSGYPDIIRNLNVLSDSTAEITVTSVAAGTWHLKIDAKNNSNEILYAGETDVVIQENITSQLFLTLNPVTSGVGSVYIFVGWGSQGQWIDYLYNPILNRTGHPGNPPSIKSGPVILDNNVYKMWYYCVYNGGWASIWYAYSNDGISWNIHNTPVLTRGGAGSWDAFSVWSIAVIKEGTSYKMFYGGYTNTYSEVPKTGIAVSSDGINWEKQSNPVFTGSGIYSYAYITSVIKKNNQYFAYLNYRSSSNSISHIGYAASSDGLAWNFNHLFSPSFTWENGEIYFPSVIFDGTKYIMIYGNRTNDAFGYAVSADGINWQRNTTPVFKKSSTSVPWTNISYPQLIKTGNELRVYYTGDSGYLSNGFCFVRKPL